MSETIYYQKNREAILNTAVRYYHDNIQIFKKKQEINIEDYRRKKILEKENMEEIDIIGDLKKLDKKGNKYKHEIRTGP